MLLLFPPNISKAILLIINHFPNSFMDFYCDNVSIFIFNIYILILNWPIIYIQKNDIELELMNNNDIMLDE